jgi:hypothetical protein
MDEDTDDDRMKKEEVLRLELPPAVATSSLHSRSSTATNRENVFRPTVKFDPDELHSIQDPELRNKSHRHATYDLNNRL